MTYISKQEFVCFLIFFVQRSRQKKWGLFVLAVCRSDISKFEVIFYFMKCIQMY